MGQAMKIPPPPSDPSQLGQSGPIPPPPADPKDLGEVDPSMLKMAGQVAKEMFGEATDFLEKEGLSIAGMAAGGSAGLDAGVTAGLAVGGPLGAVVLGLPMALGGAALGAMSGKAVTEAGEAAAKAVGLNKQPPKTPGQVIKSVGEEGKQGALSEALGLGIGGVLSETGRALLPPLQKLAPGVVRAVKAAMSADILPSMTQIMQSRAMATLEEMASKAPIIGPRIMAMRAEQEFGYDALRKEVLSRAGEAVPAEKLGATTEKGVSEILETATDKREAEIAGLRDKLLKKHGPNVETEQLGKKLDEIRVAKTAEAKQGAGKLYEDLERAIPDAQNHVADNNLRSTAKQFLDQYKNLPKATLGGDVRALLQDMKQGPGGKVVDNAPHPYVDLTSGIDPQAAMGTEAQAMAQRKTYTFGEMQTLRSDLTARIKQESLKVPRGQMTPEGRIFINLKEAVDKDIASFSQGLPGDIKKLKELADAHYASYKGTYANPTMATLGKVAKDNPEDVYRLLVKPGDVNDIRRLKAVVGEEGFIPLRRKFVDDMVTGADGKMLSGPQIVRNMAKTGMETMKEVLTPAQLKDLVQAADKRAMPEFLETEVEKNLRRLINTSGGQARAPEEIVKRVMDGDTVTIKALKNVVGEQGMKPYKRAILEDIIGSPEIAGTLQGTTPPTALRVSRNLASYGPSLQYLFNADELSEIQKIEDVKGLLESQGKLAANYAGTASSLVTGGAMAELLLNPTKAGAFVFHNPLTAAAMVLTPDILSRFYVSKMGRKLLLDGMSEKAVSNTLLASRIAAFATNALRGELLDREQTLGGNKIEPRENPNAQTVPPPPSSPSNLAPETRQLLGL